MYEYNIRRKILHVPTTVELRIRTVTEVRQYAGAILYSSGIILIDNN